MPVEIIAIRVQDVFRPKWFNWDEGVWDETPKCYVGGRLYVSFVVRNRTNATVSVSLKIRDVGWTPGADVATKPAEFLAPYTNMGIEFTGNMPYSDLPLSLIVMTGNVLIDAFPLTITRFSEIPSPDACAPGYHPAVDKNGKWFCEPDEVTPPPEEPPVTPPVVPSCVMTAIGAPLLLLGFLRTQVRPRMPAWFVRVYYRVNYHILSVFF